MMEALYLQKITSKASWVKSTWLSPTHWRQRHNSRCSTTSQLGTCITYSQPLVHCQPSSRIYFVGLWILQSLWRHPCVLGTMRIVSSRPLRTSKLMESCLMFVPFPSFRMALQWLALWKEVSQEERNTIQLPKSASVRWQSQHPNYSWSK